MPILDHSTVEFISHNSEQTRRAGIRLGSLLYPGDVICLIGDLGAGKTTLVQGITTGWGSLDHATSPTFVLVNVYRRPDGTLLSHLDAYRIENSVEALYLDIESLLDQGPLVIEWADRISQALPEENLTVRFRLIDDVQRDLLISANGDRYQNLLTKFQAQVFGVH